jgi:hypothetical protein
MDKSDYILMAVSYCYMRHPRHHNDPPAPRRVSTNANLRRKVSSNVIYRQEKIVWECDNGGALWTDDPIVRADTTVAFPSGFCAAGYPSIYTAFIVSLIVDLVFQVCETMLGSRWILVLMSCLFQIYMFFLMWRFSKRLEHYRGLKGPFYGGK